MEYNTSEWIPIKTIKDLKRAIELLPDDIEFEIDIRYLECIDEDSSSLSVQFRNSEIEV